LKHGKRRGEVKKAIILGGGFTGCTWAHLLGKKGWEVLLLEKDQFLGGGCKTFHYGGHPYTLGPRPLFTPLDYVYEFLDERVPLRRMKHFLYTYVERDEKFYSYPIHRDDIDIMPDRAKIENELAACPDPSTARNFEEYWLYSAGPTLYDKFVKNYSRKMWMLESNTVLDDFKFDGKGVSIQTGTRQVRPEFNVGYPQALNGWDDYFNICAATPGVTVMLNSGVAPEDIDVSKPAVRINGEWHEADILVSSLSPDHLLNYTYGELNYMGRDFLKLVLPVERVTPDPIVFIHYPNDELFTRVVEYKVLTGYKSDSTLIVIEIPSRNNKLYPYPVKKEQLLAEKYRSEFPEHVFSVGRMGNYRYNDIGVLVDEAMQLVKEL